MVKIYHNPRCSKSRAGLSYLTENNIEFELIDYLKVGISPSTIKEFTKTMKVSAIDLVRKQEDYYKNELKGKDFTDDQLILIISENPKLLQRPIMVVKEKAVFAQPPDKIREIL